MRSARSSPRSISRNPATLRIVSERDDLLQVINDRAVIRGDFVLSSGQHADWYIDLRRVLLSGASAALAGRVMLAVIAIAAFVWHRLREVRREQAAGEAGNRGAHQPKHRSPTP